MKRPFSLFVFLVLLGSLLAACGSKTTLRYNVTGTAEEVSVRIIDERGEPSAETVVKLPYEVQVEVGASFDFQIYVTNISGQGNIQCEVFADDQSLGDAGGDLFAGCEGHFEKQGGETQIRFTSHNDTIPDSYDAPAIKPPAGVSGMFLFAGDQKSAETRDFFVYDPIDGIEPIRLTMGLGRSSACPRLSPDGTQVAFVFGGSVSDLFLLNLNSGELANLTNDDKDGIESFCSDWLPDGSRLIYSASKNRTYQIFGIAPDGSGMMPLTSNTIKRVEYRNPVFSPDGRQIAFIAGTLSQDVYRMNTDGSDFSAFWHTEQGVRDFHWSPDGTKIVYACFDKLGEGVCLMNSDGSDSSKLTDNTLERVYYTAWSPDGTKIAFIAKKDGETNIFVINPDGSDLVQITHLQGIDPHWVSWIPSIDLPDTPIPVSIGK